MNDPTTPLQLSDSVTQSVVVHVQRPGGLGDIAIAVEQGLECQTQVSGFGVVRRQGLQNVIGERTQFALVRLEREESVYTEFVEVCDLPRPVDTSADDHGCTGLVVGRG